MGILMAITEGEKHMSSVKQLEQAEVDGFLRNLYLEERSENTVSKCSCTVRKQATENKR